MDRHGWNDRYEGRDLIWTADPNRFLVAEVESLAPGRALDLGCGEGRNAVWLAEQGWEVTAVDFSEVGIAKGREMSLHRGVEVTWVHEDLNRYEPRDASFDLVIVFYIHLPPPDRDGLLAKAARALAPGGTALVVAHDLSNLEHGYGGPQDPSLLYTPEEIAAAFSGLEVLKAGRVTRTVEKEEETFEAIDALVRAQRTATDPSVPT
jgi:SAM-dependent methyltransferase